jgi:DnaK suppressor protein
MQSAAIEGRQPVAEDSLDIADQAVLSYQKELIFSQGTEGHSQLSLVRLALERLHDGGFGECMHCTKEIGEKRLEALPWTPYCIQCQEKIESGELEGVGGVSARPQLRAFGLSGFWAFGLWAAW